MKILILLTTLISTVVLSSSFNRAANLAKHGHKKLTSYTQARKHLFFDLHKQSDDQGIFVTDVYCKKRFKLKENQIPNHVYINTEHTWPQSRFVSGTSSKVQKSDLHHLFPTDSQANSRRSSHRFMEVDDINLATPTCKTSFIDMSGPTGKNGFEPPTSHKGNVARAIFYFSVRYNGHIPDFEEEVLRQWHEQDPVDGEERVRNNKIEQIQGNRNPFIDDPSLVEDIYNF